VTNHLSNPHKTNKQYAWTDKVSDPIYVLITKLFVDCSDFSQGLEELKPRPASWSGFIAIHLTLTIPLPIHNQMGHRWFKFSILDQPIRPQRRQQSTNS